MFGLDFVARGMSGDLFLFAMILDLTPDVHTVLPTFFSSKKKK